MYYLSKSKSSKKPLGRIIASNVRRPTLYSRVRVSGVIVEAAVDPLNLAHESLFALYTHHFLFTQNVIEYHFVNPVLKGIELPNLVQLSRIQKFDVLRSCNPVPFVFNIVRALTGIMICIFLLRLQRR